MLALVSISSANASGTPLFAKNVSCCGTPFSITTNVFPVEIRHISLVVVGRRHTERHEIDTDAKGRTLRLGTHAGASDKPT